MKPPTTATEALRRFRTITPKDHLSDRLSRLQLTPEHLAPLGLAVTEGRLLAGRDLLASLTHLAKARWEVPNPEELLSGTNPDVLLKALDPEHHHTRVLVRGELMARALDCTRRSSQEPPATVTEALHRFRSLSPKDDEFVHSRAAAVGLTPKALAGLGLSISGCTLVAGQREEALANLNATRLARIGFPELDSTLATASVGDLRKMLVAAADDRQLHGAEQDVLAAHDNRIRRCVEGELTARRLDAERAPAPPPPPATVAEAVRRFRTLHPFSGLPDEKLCARAAALGLTVTALANLNLFIEYAALRVRDLAWLPAVARAAEAALDLGTLMASPTADLRRALEDLSADDEGAGDIRHCIDGELVARSLDDVPALSGGPAHPPLLERVRGALYQMQLDPGAVQQGHMQSMVRSAGTLDAAYNRPTAVLVETRDGEFAVFLPGSARAHAFTAADLDRAARLLVSHPALLPDDGQEDYGLR